MRLQKILTLQIHSTPDSVLNDGNAQAASDNGRKTAGGGMSMDK